MKDPLADRTPYPQEPPSDTDAKIREYQRQYRRLAWSPVVTLDHHNGRTTRETTFAERWGYRQQQGFLHWFSGLPLGWRYHTGPWPTINLNDPARIERRLDQVVRRNARDLLGGLVGR